MPTVSANSSSLPSTTKLTAQTYWARNIFAIPVNVQGSHWEEQLDRKRKLKKKCEFPSKGWNTMAMDKVKTLPFHDKNGLALVTGHRSGITVLDVDEIWSWTQILKSAGETEPETVRARAQNGGIHLYFKYTPDLPTCVGIFDGIDVPNDKNGCIFAPPTSFVFEGSTREYSWYPGFSLIDNPDKLLYMPGWLLGFLRSRLTQDKKKRPSSESKTKSKTKRPKSDTDSDPDAEALLDLFASDDGQAQLQKLEKLVFKLHPDRATNRNTWVNVGMVLHNVTNGSDEGLDLWDRWSQTVPEKYNKNDLDYQWGSFDNGAAGRPLGFGSLVLWAREDKNKKKSSGREDEAVKREARQFGVDHFGGVDLKSCSWNSENIVAVFKNSMHHPDHSVNCVIGPRGAFQQCSECDWRNPIFGHLAVPRSDYPALHQQFFITVNVNNYTSKDTSDPVMTIPLLEVFDDPELNDLIWKAIHYSFADDTVARIIVHLYGDRWVYSAQKWFVYEAHCWQVVEGEGKAGEYFPSTDIIALEVAGFFETVKNAYVESDEDEGIIKRISTGISGRLKNAGGISNIISRCRSLLKDEKFVRGLDQNPDLLGFTNGVYDLAANEFRLGKAEDMVSMTTGYAYEPLAEDSKEVIFVQALLDQIFPVADEKHFVLKLLGSAVHGDLRDEKFWIWIGGGANGKSTLVNLMEATLGDYATNVSSALFTGRSPSSNAPTPQLMELDKRRFVSSQEIQRNEELNLELCKKLTGGDPIRGRFLYNNSKSFTNNSKIMFCLNNLPSVPVQDKGTWRRIVLIKFRLSFVNRPNPAKPYEFKIDLTLKSKLQTFRVAMMTLLLRYHQIYLEEGLGEDVTPQFFKDQTDTYRSDNDELGDFLERYCELGEGYLLERDAFLARYAAVNGPRIDRTAIKTEMLKRFGNDNHCNDRITVGSSRPYGWKGLRLKEDVSW